MLRRVTLHIVTFSRADFLFMKCIINRRADFSASHRYWLSELTE
ncbi:MAG: 6-carboxytetrahydropterin synthase, partial [Cyanobacteria bacterium P01_F01_bin.143]